MPQTSRGATMHPISLREVQVIRAYDLTPGMRRITLGGPQLDAFTSSNGLPQPGFRSDGFDDEIRLVFPHPGDSEPILPVQIEGSIRVPEDGRVLSRPYTVRRWNPETREMDVDVVLHGTGIAATWAAHAVPGDRINFFGPLVSHSLPDADWLLVAGDETALPAIARLLEEVPESAVARVFIEIADDAHRQELRQPSGVEITWLSRDGSEPGTTTLLQDAVASSRWPSGLPFAWIAGEQATVRDLRRHLVGDRDLPKKEIDFTGYWKRRPVVTLAEDSTLPDPDQDAKAEDRFHDLTEIVPPVAIRVAVQLGLGELIARGVGTTTALARETGSDERALGKLLRYLHVIELLDEVAPGEYRLSDVGENLIDDHWKRALHPDSAQARGEVGIYGLAESVRTGKASYASLTGQSFAALRAEQWFEDVYLEEITEQESLVASAIARSSALDGVAHVVVYSPGAEVLARELVAARPGMHVTICALPSQADWLRRNLFEAIRDDSHRARVAIAEQSIFEPSPVADAVLIVTALAEHPDADAVHALRRASAGLPQFGRMLVFEELYEDETLPEHAAERDLLALTRDGTGMRTEADLLDVIQRAELAVAATHSVGWGSRLYQLAHDAQG